MSYNLYQYNDNNIRIVITKGFPRGAPTHEKKEYIPQKEEGEALRCSLSRSKRMIREYALCNDFTYFFTSTVNSEKCDRFSLSETQKRIREIMKAIKRKNKDFKYLFITEKHKNGAFHFHGLCNDLEVYINENGYYSSKDFDKLGFNSFSKIKNKDKVSNYITKYITKDCVKNEAGSVYFCSRGLKKATRYEIQSLRFRRLHFKKTFWEWFLQNLRYKLYTIKYTRTTLFNGKYKNYIGICFSKNMVFFCSKIPYPRR